MAQTVTGTTRALDEIVERVGQIRQDIETHWQARYEALAEKVEDFDRGILTLGELVAATKLTQENQ